MPGPSAAQIIATLTERRKDRAPELEAKRRVRDAYNGDIVIPLPELDRNELPAVINFVNTGLDQLAGRVASVIPDVYSPPMREGFQNSMEKARTRRRALLSWWGTNDMDAKLARRARYLMGYAESPVLIRPNAKWGISKWEVRNPLGAYPCPTGDPDEVNPPDGIFTYVRTYAWLANRYPEAMAVLNTGTPFGQRCDPAEKFEVIEYADADCFVLACLGKHNKGTIPGSPGTTPGAPFVELERLPNRAEVSPVVAPSRITLDRPMGQFDGMIGMYQTMAKLTALEIIAVERGIFPESYLISRPNETARFLAGPFDGRTGMVNIVAGGDIKEVTPNPGFASTNVVDRIERAARATGGVAAELTGESPTNVRTGKRGDAVMGAILDNSIAEAQKTLRKSLEAENRIAIAQAKAYFGNQRRSFYISRSDVKDAQGHVDYTPNDAFETDVNVVTYPLAGADQAGLIIGIGQRVGMGTMSAQTAAELDPMIADAELEKRRVQAEALDRAMLTAIEQQAAQGAIAPHDVARLKSLLITGKSIEEAIEQVQAEAQQRQATPVAPDEPEAQSGIAQPGIGAEQPTVAPPSAGQSNLSDLLNALRRPVRETPQERGAA